jgi:hypothetical protein
MHATKIDMNRLKIEEELWRTKELLIDVLQDKKVSISISKTKGLE